MATFSAVLGLLNPKAPVNGRVHHRGHEGESNQMRKTKRSPDSLSHHLDASQPRQKRPALSDITRQDSSVHNQFSAKPDISGKPNISHRKLEHGPKTNGNIPNGKEKPARKAPPQKSAAPEHHQPLSLPNPCPNSSVLSSAPNPSNPFVDIDVHYASSEKHCTEYAAIIYDYLRMRENTFLPNPNYMVEVQGEIKEGMREILVDWLVEVAEEYQLSLETLFLTKNFIDRYLSRVSLNRSKLQLLGISSLLVASKFEVLLFDSDGLECPAYYLRIGFGSNDC
jgi:hypothetical protein